MSVYVSEAIVDGNMGLRKPGIERYVFPSHVSEKLQSLVHGVTIKAEWEMGPKMAIIITSENQLSSEELTALHSDISHCLSDHASVGFPEEKSDTE